MRPHGSCLKRGVTTHRPPSPHTHPAHARMHAHFASTCCMAALGVGERESAMWVRGVWGVAAFGFTPAPSHAKKG
jgi:hypothetical protein